MNTLFKLTLAVTAGLVAAYVVKRNNNNNKEKVNTDTCTEAMVDVINEEITKEDVKRPAIHQGAVHYFYLKDALELIASTTGNHINPFETFDDESAFATMIYGKDCSGIRVYVAEDGRLFTISKTREPNNFIKDIIVESTPLDLTDDNDRETKALLIQKDAKTSDAINDTSSIKDMK